MGTGRAGGSKSLDGIRLNDLQYATIIDPERDIPCVQCTRTPTCSGSLLPPPPDSDCRPVSIQSQAPFKWRRRSSRGSSSMSICLKIIWVSGANLGASSGRVMDRTCVMLRDLRSESERAAKRL
jgi:hypothetical protein